jgi:ribosome-associated toxin RatA of RatAB toxin-antitoxin module
MERSRLLSRTLLANGVFSLASGLALALAPASVAAMLGISGTAPLVALAPGLLLFGASLLPLARSAAEHPGRALVATVLDVAWVVGSVVLLVGWSPHFGPPGRLVIGGVAAVVATFALLQLAGLRNLNRNDGARGSYRSTIETRRLVPVDPTTAWSVISDVDRYAELATGLRFSRALSGSGVGLRRECGDHHGRSWTETCSAWEDGRVYAMEVNTGADDYPYPLDALRGEWRVTEVDGGTELAIRFDFTVKGGLLGEVLAAFMAPKARREMEAVLDRWAETARTGRARAVA